MKQDNNGLYRGTHYHVTKLNLNGTICYCVARNMGVGVIYISRNLDDAISRLKEEEKPNQSERNLNYNHLHDFKKNFVSK